MANLTTGATVYSFVRTKKQHESWRHKSEIWSGSVHHLAAFSPFVSLFRPLKFRFLGRDAMLRAAPSGSPGDSATFVVHLSKSYLPHGPWEFADDLDSISLDAGFQVSGE